MTAKFISIYLLIVKFYTNLFLSPSVSISLYAIRNCDTQMYVKTILTCAPQLPFTFHLHSFVVGGVGFILLCQLCNFVVSLFYIGMTACDVARTAARAYTIVLAWYKFLFCFRH